MDRSGMERGGKASSGERPSLSAPRRGSQSASKYIGQERMMAIATSTE
jgi:hypothetical protein